MKIPTMDFRGNKFVNEDGTLSDVAQAFFDNLIDVLTKGAGDEGLQVPSQSNPDIITIQDHTVTGPTGISTKTCQFATLIGDTTNNKLMVALDNGSGTIVFKNILTA